MCNVYFCTDKGNETHFTSKLVPQSQTGDDKSTISCREAYDYNNVINKGNIKIPATCHYSKERQRILRVEFAIYKAVADRYCHYTRQTIVLLALLLMAG